MFMCNPFIVALSDRTSRRRGDGVFGPGQPGGLRLKGVTFKRARLAIPRA